MDKAEDGALVKKTFETFATTELRYRNQSKMTVADVLEDIYETSLCIVSRGASGKGNFAELTTGIQRVSRFIFSETFHIDKAITCASKAAYMASLMKAGKKEIEKYQNPAIMKDWVIGEALWPKLNRLKKSNPEAFFYWYKTFELTTMDLPR